MEEHQGWFKKNFQIQKEILGTAFMGKRLFLCHSMNSNRGIIRNYIANQFNKENDEIFRTED